MSPQPLRCLFCHQPLPVPTTRWERMWWWWPPKHPFHDLRRNPECRQHTLAIQQAVKRHEFDDDIDEPGQHPTER